MAVAGKETESMFWADQIARNASGPQVVNDSKTPSGRVHVGALRGVIIHDLIFKALKDAGKKAVFLYGNDDFDPMDSLPAYLPAEKWKKHMGEPLSEIPAPSEGADNYADYYFNEFQEVFEKLGCNPKTFKMSELYKSGKLNATIKTVLENAEKTREIYKRVSGSEKEEGWLPLSVICPECGKIGTTRAFDFDGETVAFKCEPSLVAWAQGCGFEGRASPFDGKAKLTWKLEWVAQWIELGVTIEGAGKDHFTAGGARDVSNTVMQEVFKSDSPLDLPYEFFLIGGKKMSSSKGLGATSREVAGIMPPELLRFLMARYKPQSAINFDPSGDTLPRLFDYFDRFGQAFYGEVKPRDPDEPRIFKLSQVNGEPVKRFTPSFSLVASLAQLPQVDLTAVFSKRKGSPLTKEDKEALGERVRYARIWLEKFAPDEARITLLEDASEERASLNEGQRKALKDFASFFEKEGDEEKQKQKIADLCKEESLPIQQFFEAAYLVLIGRKKGPRLLSFINALDKEFVAKTFSGE